MTLVAHGAFARADTEPYPAPSGIRLPVNARHVWQTLMDAGQPLKAYCLLERLRDKGISAPMTVYRALDRLIELGLVRRVESLNAFMALPEVLRGRPVAFRICKGCGLTQVVRLDDAIMAGLGQAGLPEGEPYVEIYIPCVGC